MVTTQARGDEMSHEKEGSLLVMLGMGKKGFSS